MSIATADATRTHLKRIQPGKVKIKVVGDPAGLPWVNAIFNGDPIETKTPGQPSHVAADNCAGITAQLATLYEDSDLRRIESNDGVNFVVTTVVSIHPGILSDPLAGKAVQTYLELSGFGKPALHRAMTVRQYNPDADMPSSRMMGVAERQDSASAWAKYDGKKMYGVEMRWAVGN